MMPKRGRPIVRRPGRICQAPQCTKPVAGGIGHWCRNHYDKHRKYGDVQATYVRMDQVGPYMQIVYDLLEPLKDHRAIRAAVAIVGPYMDSTDCPHHTQAWADWAGRYEIRYEPLRFVAGILGAMWWGLRVGDYGPRDAYFYQTVKLACRFVIGRSYVLKTGADGETMVKKTLFPPRLATVYAGRGVIADLAPLLRMLDKPIQDKLEADLPAPEKLQKHIGDLEENIQQALLDAGDPSARNRTLSATPAR